MAVVLAITWDGAGNFPPERALVRELVSRGHEVHVLAFDTQSDAIKADGAVFHPLEGVVQLSATDRAVNRDRSWMVKNVAMGPGYGASLTKTLGLLRPNLVLVDFVLGTAMTAGVHSGTTTIALGHSIYSPLRESPIGPSVEACARVLIFSYRELDPAKQLPEKCSFFSPYRAAVTPRPTGRQRPAIVVSLSTSFQEQGDLIQRLCNATASLDTDVLVTTGDAYHPSEFSAGTNTKIVRYARHDEVLPETDLLITHAGHGTVMAGARHGTPMVCMPMGRDQPYVAAQAERIGLCRLASPEASAQTLREIIVATLKDDVLKSRSLAFAAAVAHTPNITDAAVALENMIA